MGADVRNEFGVFAMTQRNSIRLGASCFVVAVLLVAWVAFVSTGDPASDLATEAAELEATSTTASPSTTSTTAAPTTVLSRTTGTVAEATGDNLKAPGTLANVTPKVEHHPTAVQPKVSADSAKTIEPDVAETVSEQDPNLTADSDTSSENTTEAATSAKSPAAVTISRPSCAATLGAPKNQTAPFTGMNANIPSGMPAVVIKVSNNSSASRRVLVGLDQADIVFEERIEASATRFFSVFHSSLPPNVGPVRSGRTTDIQITQNLNNPVFAYSGSNQGVARQINFAAENGILTPFINTDRAPFARDSRYQAPDNLFADPTSLGACGGNRNPTAVFSYGPASSTTAKAASSVSLQARSPYRFDWNGSAWVRSQSGSPHVTRNGVALAPKNVVVLFVPYVPSQIDSASVDAETIGSGNAWVFRDGTVTDGGWQRSKGHEPYTLTDGAGAKVNLTPGQTWVVLAPAGSASYN